MTDPMPEWQIEALVRHRQIGKDFDEAMARIISTFEDSGDELTKMQAEFDQRKYVIPETCCPYCEGRPEGVHPVVCGDCRRDLRDED